MTTAFAPTLAKSELRKVFTTSSWWGLLIPTALLSLAWSWIISALVSLIIDYFNSRLPLVSPGARIPDLPFGSFALARAIDITTIFPMVFGGLAIATELHRRTITTTYLTAPSRLSVMTSKLGVYALLGAAYGVVIVAVASLGLWLGALSSGNYSYLPGVGVWLAIAGAGVLSAVLWTLLGVGVGALFGNVVATVIGLLLYTLIVENLLSLVLPRVADHFPAFLINSSGVGMVAGIAAEDLVAKIPDIPFDLREPVVEAARYAAGAGGTYAWWIEALIFLAWTAIFCGLGWYVSNKRDIT